MSSHTISSGVEYRPDIDGLRAIAVLSVVIYHAFPSYIKGGFVGVDVFFVISGFLITSIILSKLRVSKFSFIEFYTHRINRIFPALILVLSFTYLIGWLELLPADFIQLGKHTFSASTFTSNYTFLGESGYFDAGAENKPLLHLWSLAIEEQFYIFWPFVVWIFSSKKVKLYWVLLALCIASFALNVITVVNDVSLAFFSLQTRFWELLVGSSLAFFRIVPLDFKYITFNSKLVQFSICGRNSHDLIALLGGGLIFSGFFLLSRDLLFPGYWALIPTIGAAFIVFAEKSWVNKKILSNRLLVFIGLISYPLYLWHWPLLSFATILEAGVPSARLRIAIILVSLILAWMTYSFIEKPIRHRSCPIINHRILIVLLVITGLLGYFTQKFDGYEGRKFATENKKIADAIGDWAYPGKLVQKHFNDIVIQENSLQKASFTHEIIFLGDSHIEQLGPGVDDFGKRLKVRTTFITGGGCIPIPNVLEDKHTHCKNLLSNFEQYLRIKKESLIIVVGACWNCYFINQTNPLLQGDYSYYYSRDGVKYGFATGLKGSRYALDQLSVFLKELSLQHKVYLLLDNPSDIRFDPKYILRNYSTGGYQVSFKISQNQLDLNEKLKLLANNAGVEVVDQMARICPNGLCTALSNSNLPIYKDSNHMRPYYVIKNLKFIDEALVN
jgi:peptidoglycan/LPS O-acetylase OafA/YrhL